MSARDAVSALHKLKKLASFILLALLVALPACNLNRQFDFMRGARLTGGNPELGRKRLAQHSCVSCHVIPGVPRGDGNSAQSLAHWSARRTFLNTCENTPGKNGWSRPLTVSQAGQCPIWTSARKTAATWLPICSRLIRGQCRLMTGIAPC